MGSVMGKRGTRDKQHGPNDFSKPGHQFPSTVYEDPEESAEVTLQFSPGFLGVDALWDTGEIHSVSPGSPADVKGVEEGWKMIKVNHHQYTEQILDSCLQGTKEFFITFDKDSDVSGSRSANGVGKMSIASLASEENTRMARMRGDFLAKWRQDAVDVPIENLPAWETSEGSDLMQNDSPHNFVSEVSYEIGSHALSENRKPVLVDTIQEDSALEEPAASSTTLGEKHLQSSFGTKAPFGGALDSLRGGMSRSPRPSHHIAAADRDDSSEEMPSEILPHTPMDGDYFHELTRWKVFCRPNPFLRYTEEWLEGRGGVEKGDGREPLEDEVHRHARHAATAYEEDDEEDEGEETEQERLEREFREEEELAAAEYKASEVQRVKNLLKNSCDGWKLWLTGRNTRSELKVIKDDPNPVRTTFSSKLGKASRKNAAVVKEKRLFQVAKYREVEETIIYDDEELKRAQKQKRVLPATRIRTMPFSELVERTVNVEVEAESVPTSKALHRLKVMGESWFRAPLDAQTLGAWSENSGHASNPNVEIVCWRSDFIDKALRDAVALGLEKPVVAAEAVRDWVRKDWSLLETFRWYVEVVSVDGGRFLWSSTFVSYLWEYWQRSKLGDHVCKSEAVLVAEARREGTTDELFKRKPVKWPQPVKRPPRWKIPERVISRVEKPEVPSFPYRLPHKDLFKPDTLEKNLRAHLQGTEAWEAMTGSSGRLRAAGRAMMQERLEQAFADAMAESGCGAHRLGSKQ